VLVRIFEPKREEVTGEWRKVNNEESHDKYSLPNTEMIKSGWMSWMGHVVCRGNMVNVLKILTVNMKGTDHLDSSQRQAHVKMILIGRLA
jgi:hypothetical protein